MHSQYQETKLYMMCGLPFSGKTTLSKEVARRFNARRISMDEINDERGIGIDGAPISPDQWVETYRLMYWRVGEALSQGETVVLDAPNFTKEQRRDVATIAADYLVGSRVIFVSVSAHECRRRWKANRRTMERHDVRDDNFELGPSSFEPPDESEVPLIYEQDLTPTEWIRSTFP